MPSEQCEQVARTYRGRSGNCPQIHFSHQSGVAFLKNLALLVEGGALTASQYKPDHLAEFRLELYSTVARIGNSEQKALPF